MQVDVTTAFDRADERGLLDQDQCAPHGRAAYCRGQPCNAVARQRPVSAGNEVFTMRLDIEFGHLPHSGAVEVAAREGADMLRRICSQAMECRVTLAGPPDGHHLGQHMRVDIHVVMPNTAVDVSHVQDGCEGPEKAVQAAFEAACQRLLPLASN